MTHALHSAGTNHTMGKKLRFFFVANTEDGGGVIGEVIFFDYVYNFYALRKVLKVGCSSNR